MKNSVKRRYITAAVCLMLAALLLNGCFAKKKGNAPAQTEASVSLSETQTTAAPTAPAPTTSEPTTAEGTTAEATAEATAAPPTTAEPTAAEPTTAEPTTAEPTTAQNTVPGTKEEIIAFFAQAVNRVKSGAAGYVRKEFDTLGNMNITGNSLVDNSIKGIVGGFLVTENQAKPQSAAKGSAEAAQRIPGWELTDFGMVAFAGLVPAGEDYTVTIVLQDEDSPRRGESHLAAVGSVLYLEDVQEKLKDISALKNVDDMHIRYRNYTITATLTSDGRLKALQHHADLTVEMGRVEVTVMTLQNVGFTLEHTIQYSDFTY